MVGGAARLEMAHLVLLYLNLMRLLCARGRAMNCERRNVWRFDGEEAESFLYLRVNRRLNKSRYQRFRLCSSTCRARGEDDLCLLPLNFYTSGMLMCWHGASLSLINFSVLEIKNPVPKLLACRLTMHAVHSIQNEPTLNFIHGCLMSPSIFWPTNVELVNA